jgi:hypothetical protein
MSTQSQPSTVVNPASYTRSMARIRIKPKHLLAGGITDAQFKAIILAAELDARFEADERAARVRELARQRKRAHRARKAALQIDEAGHGR